jgi:short-subunit dehydrogenase involved in D-alanine esterification of teichoic acids
MPGIEGSKCILVTGATAGIGRALALSLAKLPSKPQVIAAGRRQDRLDELKKAGLETLQLELNTDAISIKKSVDHLLEKYPQVCVPINLSERRSRNCSSDLRLMFSLTQLFSMPVSNMNSSLTRRSMS